MRLDILMNINSDIKQKQFLRENSYWYKYFLNDMKEKYKLTTPDKLNKMMNNINMFKTFLDVLK